MIVHTDMPQLCTSRDPQSLPWRVALYSHDTMGLGHIRRNMLIAHSLVSCGLPVQILLVTGSREASQFTLPPGVDALTLPAVCKNQTGHYESRHLSIALPDIIEMRSSAISAALDSFQPDLFIVDNVPRGVACELDPALEMLNSAGRTRCILGLRDVLDEPDAVCKQWNRCRNFHTVHHFYDSVWIYGDPEVYDSVQEYGFPTEVANKTRYLGYLDQSQRPKIDKISRSNSSRPDRIAKPYILCLLGGGEDGVRVAQGFMDASLPKGTQGVLVTGPMMPADTRAEFQAQAKLRGDMTILTSVADTARLINEADRVITMGGYNTVGEVLLSETPALIVPRVRPRQEQWIRASRLKEKGLVDVMHPDQIDTARLSAWLSEHDKHVKPRRCRIDMSGLVRLQSEACDMLESSPIRHTKNTKRSQFHVAG